MSTRSGEKPIILAPTTYAAVDTWYECDEQVKMWQGADQLRLYISNTVARAGQICFKLQTKNRSGDWCDIIGSGAVWCTRQLEVGDCVAINLNGAGLCANDEVKVFYKAQLNAASAVLEIQALAHDSNMWSGPYLESNGGMPVNTQDQSTPPIDSYFLQSVSNFTLALDTVASGVSVLTYTFTATTGHGITDGDEILLLSVDDDRSFYAEALSVVGDVITVDRPIDFSFPAATSLGRIVTSQMAVVGSLASPQIFSVRAGENPADHTRVIMTMLDDTAMDDGKFGGIAALTNGIVFRIINGFQKTIFNFKTNGDIRQFCYDVDYLSKAPAGQNGLGARISFGGHDKHGVVLRLSTGDVLQWVVQDDLTDITSLKIVVQGHDTTS